MKNKIRLSILCGLFFLLMSCQAVRKIKCKIHSEDILNVSESKESLPVLIKIYQLHDKQAFIKASFNELWKQDKTILGNSLLQSKECIIGPGTHTTVTIPLEEKANYLGFFAAYRAPQEQKWQAIYRVPKGFFASNTIEVLLTESAIKVK